MTRRLCGLIASMSLTVLAAGVWPGFGPGIPGSLAQVFPPRSNTQSVPAPPQGQGGQPGGAQAPVPQAQPPHMQMPASNMPGQYQPPPPPAPLQKTVPFTTLLGGDLSKSYVQLTNLRGQMDSNFVIGRSLAGRFTLPPYIHDASNAAKVYILTNGLSNPPIVKPEGNELHLEFHFPALQLKTYYKDYSPEGDQAVGDTVGEGIIIDVFLIPVTNHQGYPTYQSARTAFRGQLKSQDKCVFWFDVIFPINICDVSKKYLATLGSAIENGMREALLHPQTRTQFDQVVWQSLRTDLLMQAGVNPMSPAQIMVLEGAFRGTDYVVKYLPR
ncbi:exported protein of unknown function [Nitrospira japonica]|uniref:Uncharacterized protein n=1 Tax=Nitrospira japonica TaxID=1325564 RepID=A0A1W1I8D3_9BACT|nr:hypothetical protein [Nitrospira japonica]SLM49181.1 exported protein of unknown function [Nitrospira japonica]